LSTNCKVDRALISKTDYAISEAQQWFAEHVTLDGKPYTLDQDQTRAVTDCHENTLVTARAGSGKTRVIVAKVAYLVAHEYLPLSEIAIFMFNRTAAAEVNQRIGAVKIDGQNLVATNQPVKVASTFHKYALDIVKQAGEKPKIIDDATHDQLIRQALDTALASLKHRTSPNERRELLGIVSGFIARAGQKFPGAKGFAELTDIIKQYLAQASDEKSAFYHTVAYQTYAKYLSSLQSPLINFNLLMARATEILEHNHNLSEVSLIRHLKYIMIDEYQDFSYLFFALTKAIRCLAPTAHLFAVGDDWQAINRFAGSDVDYFLNFSHYFPEDHANVPLATNYRSARKIVERANHYMLTNYNPAALPAEAFSHERGKIKFLHPTKLRFDATDIQEDGLADGRFQLALAKAAHLPVSMVPTPAAQLLKQIFKIIKRHRRSEILCLHRHNFTTFENINLETLYSALELLVTRESLLTAADFKRQIRCMTMHKSKGLESEIVILLEVDRAVIQSNHPHATIFQLFGDTQSAEAADQKRLLYVAMTRAKRQLYILSSDQKPLI